VPKICYRAFATATFDRGASLCSLFRPPDVVATLPDELPTALPRDIYLNINIISHIFYFSSTFFMFLIFSYFFLNFGVFCFIMLYVYIICNIILKY